ncbi:MAG: VOC family protein [Actinomycetota bacterium]|nr:VOC family protein [Actinomycetota bacterium]
MAKVGSLRWVHVFVDVPDDVAEQTREFWSRALCWPTGEPWEQHPEYTSLRPPEGDSYVHVQVIGDDARIHLDLVVDDLDEARARVVALGSTAGTRAERWQVMRSPGGLPFCLCLHPAGGIRPPGTAHEGGHRSRLAQVCIDAPAPLFDRELEFWRQVTGWQTSRSGRPEFTDLVGPEDATLQLLLQRLDDHDPGTTVRAHIDLGSDDRDAEAERLVGIGAHYVERFDGWIVLRDAAGLDFCVTGKSPE